MNTELTSLNDFVGQPILKRKVSVALQASKRRRATAHTFEEQMDARMPHTLLIGRPGSGKSTMARIICEELGASYNAVDAPVKLPWLANVVAEYAGGFLLIDEVHRFSKTEQEALLPLIRDDEMRLPSGKTVKMEYPFTIVCATSEPQKLIKPFYDRFRIKTDSFEEYSESDMAQIVVRMGSDAEIYFPEDQTEILARAAAGNPRQVEEFVTAARDLETLDATKILDFVGVTKDGLRTVHMEYLQRLHDCGGNAGLDILSSHLNLAKDVLMDVEKLLVSREFITFGKGRTLTMLGRKAINAQLVNL